MTSEQYFKKWLLFHCVTAGYTFLFAGSSNLSQQIVDELGIERWVNVFYPYDLYGKTYDDYVLLVVDPNAKGVYELVQQARKQEMIVLEWYKP